MLLGSPSPSQRGRCAHNHNTFCARGRRKQNVTIPHEPPVGSALKPGVGSEATDKALPHHGP